MPSEHLSWSPYKRIKRRKAKQSKLERPITPETYLGFDRGWSYTASNAIEENRTALYDDDAGKYLRDDQVGLSGLWRSEPQKIIAEGKAGGEGAENGRGAEGAEDKWSELDLNFLATQVYLVMESEAEEPARIAVYLDGKPLERKYYTKDMDERGHILVKEARKYELSTSKKITEDIFSLCVYQKGPLCMPLPLEMRIDERLD